ncbi:MAG: adenylyl-sulfate kinase, partial [Nitrosomonas sp.]
LQNIVAIPMSALKGDNITELSRNTPWYSSDTLMSYLENVQVEDAVEQSGVFRMPVQWVNRPNLDFRGYSGMVVRGSVKPGDAIRVLPSGRESRVARIVTQDGDLEKAISGQSITLTLTDEIDISRGDVLATTDSPPGVANQFEATVVWMTDEAMLPGRPYLMKIGTKTVTANVSTLKHKVNVNTLEQVTATKLELNEIGVCNLSTDQLIAFDPYNEDRDTGGFIMIDRLTNNTVGAGMLHSALRQSHDNSQWQDISVNKQAHAALKGQKPFIIWFTGLSGSGKSTIAILLERKLYSLGKHTYLLDGDTIRHGLNKDLGFTDADRIENVRRTAEVAKLMVDAGQIVLVSMISPFSAEREMARELVAQGEFFEVFVDVPIQAAEERDPKGLYKKARSGELKDFTGLDSPYEVPENPEVRIDTTTQTPEQAVEHIINYLLDVGVLG